MIILIIILIIIIISMFGWIYSFNKRVEKLEILVELKKPKAEITEENFGCIKWQPYPGRPQEFYTIQVKIIKKIGDKYLVSFIESYPKMNKWLKATNFTNNKTFVTAEELGLNE